MDKEAAVPVTDQPSTATAYGWKREIETYDRESQAWVTRSKKILKRYKDERQTNDKKNRINILWSNIQTLQPAMFAQNPKVNISRRFNADDDVSRIASDVLERCTAYFVENEVFYSVMSQTVLDRLLPGRGTAWCRYVPNFIDMSVKGDDEIEAEGVQVTNDAYPEPSRQELLSEDICWDYVHWEDFGHTWARTWDEVTAGWRKVYMSRSELIERFGEEKGKNVPLDHAPEKLSDEKVSDVGKKATVYEIWCKTTRKVYWVHKDVPDFLDERDDPLKLKSFFPFPRPLFATLANDSVIPVPDYAQYQDQAQELDLLTAKIMALTKAIKVAGAYDSSAKGLERILAEGAENLMVPVDQWAIFAGQGGIAGAMSFLPLDQVMKALLGLYEAREKTKQDLYEVTGISDIIRGSTKASETLGAQQLKGQFATLRLSSKQNEVQMFARDLVQIGAEIIAEHFSPETMKSISGIKLMTAQEKAMVQQQMQMAQQTGQPLPPLTIAQQTALDGPTWEEIIALLKNDLLREFRIDIETDSTIKMNQEDEKKQRIELITAAGQFIQQAALAPPQLQPLMGQILLFGVRGFKIGKELEGEFKTAIKQLEEAAKNPPPQGDDGATAQAQADQAKVQSDQMIAAQKIQSDEKIATIQVQSEQQIEQMKASIKADNAREIEQMRIQAKGELETMKAEYDAFFRSAEMHHKMSTETLKGN